MAFPRRLLAPGEQVIVHTRKHGKTLVPPALVLIAVGALFGAGMAYVPASRPGGRMAVVLICSLLAFFWVVLPFLRWRAFTYTVTNRRLITRQAIAHPKMSELPLSWMLHVSYRRSLTDRMLGCGTLRIATASRQGILMLPDIPDVEWVHGELTHLVFGTNPRFARTVLQRQ